jgi:hypothetical protein
MDCNNPVPRVNFELLQQHLGKRVKLVCKVERTENNNLIVTAADGGTVYIQPSGKSQFDGLFLEIEGIVQTPNTIKEEEVASFGSGDFGELAGVHCLNDRL